MSTYYLQSCNSIFIPLENFSFGGHYGKWKGETDVFKEPMNRFYAHQNSSLSHKIEIKKRHRTEFKTKIKPTNQANKQTNKNPKHQQLRQK